MKINSLIVSILMLFSCCFGATPTYNSFNTEDFGNNGVSIWLKKTNVVNQVSGSATLTTNANGVVLNVSSSSGSGVATNLFNFPKEIYIVAGVYGMAYRMTPTNSGVNSGGQFYTPNPYYGNGSLWSDYASNVLSSDYGIVSVVDSSISHPSFGEPQDVASGSIASAYMPPWDKQTPTLYWLHQRSPNSTGTNKLIYLHAPQAGIESGTYTAAEAFAAVTNLALIFEKDGWTVALGTFVYNYDYWVAYTNQTASGIRASNYDVAVRNASGRWPVVDMFRITTNWATRSDLTQNTNYYCGNNHIGYWTGQAIGSNFVRYLITNPLVVYPKQFTPFVNSNVKRGWIGWMGGGSWIPNYTNPAPVFGIITNSGVLGGPRTNPYAVVNMTVSNLLPNTSYEYHIAFHLQAGNPANSGGRWDLRTDSPVRDWEYSGRTIYPSSGDILGSKVNGDSGANNSIVGGQRAAGAGQANVGANIHGSFTTGTNVTALQMWYAPETTNVANVIKSGFLRVWPSLTQ